MNSYIEPPEGLLKKIIERIRKEERILVLKRIFLLSSLFLASLVGLVFSSKTLLANFAKSGFLNFFALAFSDFSTMFSHWQSFTMILLETLPSISIALFLAVLLTMLQSIKLLSKNIKIIRNNSRLAVN